MLVSNLLALCIILLYIPHVLSNTVNILATTPPIDSTRDLQDAIYTTFTGGPACVLLLNATAEIGCSTPGAHTDGILIRTNTSLLALPSNSVALISPYNAADLLEGCIPTGCPNLAGVLVESGRPPSFSSASKAPLSHLALFGNPDYPWNPLGSSLLLHRFTFPVLLLDNSTTDNAITRATYNEEILTMNDSNAGQQNVAKISLKMEAEGGNSTSCLASNTCVPLGGYSSIAALPSLGRISSNNNNNSNNNNEDDGPGSVPALLVIAAVDTASFFHGEEQAADAPLSGLIAMLTAARVLGKHPSMQSNTINTTKRRIYFAAMVGEPWDLMGSKRLLWEASQPGTNISSILSLDSIESIIDVGQIGRAGDGDGNKQERGGMIELFTHANPASASSPTSESIVKALQKAASQITSSSGDDDGTVITVVPSTVTTELPPSSTNAFLRVLPQDTPSIALNEFDTAFINPYFTSQYDTVDQVSNTTMAATASLLIRTLYDLALLDNNSTGVGEGGGGEDAFPPPTPLVVNETFVLETVEELSGCLMTSNPGLYCSLATDLITPAYGPVPSHYVGILRWPTSDPQNPDPNSKKDVERFIWNYLAFATSGTNPSINNNENKGDGDGDVVVLCSPYNTTACSAGEVCAGARDLPSPQGMGLCLRATVQYVASYSTSLTYVNSTWQTTRQAEEWEVEYGWPQPDPMWTESNWPTGVPSVEMYLNESESVDVAILIAGVVVTVVSGLVAGVMIAAYRKRMKQD